MPQMHISYYSLENNHSNTVDYSFGGTEPQQTATNAYFRFDTTDIFAYDTLKKPQAFFDFIVISHCFLLIKRISL